MSGDSSAIRALLRHCGIRRKLEVRIGLPGEFALKRSLKEHWIVRCRRALIAFAGIFAGTRLALNTVLAA